MGNIISDYSDKYITYNHYVITNPDDRKYTFHTHDICEIIFLNRWNISAVIEDKTYKLKKGSLVIFRSSIPHKIQIDGIEDYERTCVIFNENSLANGIFEKISTNLDVIECSGNNRITELFDKLDYYCKTFTADDFKILLLNIIEELLFNIYTESTENFNDSSTGQPHDPQRNIQRKRSGADNRYIHDFVIAETHDGAFTEFFFDLIQCDL